MISEDAAKSILQKDLNVSRETFSDLKTLADLLVKWNKTINLVSPRTLNHLWARHILDSAQIWHLRPADPRTWVDLGSGAGFPVLVLAILAKQDAPDTVFHSFESDTRKCAFIRNVSRETSLNITTHNMRIENATATPADVISARALAPLDHLLRYAEKFQSENTLCLFLKGKESDKELRKACESWSFQHGAVQSLTDPLGRILKIWDVCRV